MTDSLGKTQPGITLVLGTGLLKCAASLGLMHVLKQEKIPVHEIVASSAGALFAAAIALDYSPAQIKPFLMRVSHFYRTASLTPRRRLQILLPRLFGFNEAFGLADSSAFAKLFQDEFGEKAFQDCQLPLTVVATNFANGRRVLLDHGPLWQALCVTCSPLGLLPPLLVDGQLLIEGAVCDPLPIAVAAERKAQVIVVLGFENPEITHIRSLPNYTNQFRNILVNHLLNAQTALSNAVFESEIIMITPKFGAMIDQTDGQKFDFIIDKGAEAAESVVSYLKTLVTA